VAAQKQRRTSLAVPLWEDTAINPHDFNDEYYATFGIKADWIIGRRTGADGLSVISNSSNPFHRNVRVTITAPAYDHNGDMLFWYPLGELPDYAMPEALRELGMQFPIYIFPDTKVVDYRTFASTRQAALMDNSFSMPNTDIVNPLGIRQIVVVNFTEKAFSKEGFEMMQFFLKKNGAASDDTPIIRTMEDMQILEKNEMIKADWKSSGGLYAINPIMLDPTNGAIAKDAFMWMATKDGTHLPDEDDFAWQFQCLQKTGDWCK
jgi:hypothetical protein